MMIFFLNFKHKNFLLKVFSKILFFYLKIVYLTSKWEFIFSNSKEKDYFHIKKHRIFVLWHNILTLGPGIFYKSKNIYALTSPHSDGKIISNIIQGFGFGNIVGSTNRNSVKALKEIIKKLKNGSNIVITPDGPRGPIYEINSNINKIAYKHNFEILPIGCVVSKHIKLKSWDRLIIPLPFSKIKVTISNPIKLSGNLELDNKTLKQTLMICSK